MFHFDLNCDLGEYVGAEQAALEATIMPYISSCNIACGGHIGDEESMRQTIRLAQQHGVTVGAHPAYPDRENFGRKSMQIDERELRLSLQNQLETLIAIAQECETKVRYVKPHGALYNDCAQQPKLALFFATVIAQLDPKLTVLGLPNSAIAEACKQLNQPFAAEGFADRAYTATGFLVDRKLPNAVYSDITQAANQAVALAQQQEITAYTGETLLLKVASVCVHGDSAHALEMVQVINRELKARGVVLQSFCA